MKLLICAGMTGGGVYPALAVLQTLNARIDDVLWVGSEGGMENDLIPRLSIPFKAIPAAGIHGVSLRKLPGNVRKLTMGYKQARTIIQSFQPDVFFSTGGYLSVPVARAARNIPSVIFIPDIEPGLALKTLVRNADEVLVSVEETRGYLNKKKNVTVCGYPLRKEITQWDRISGRKQFKLNEDLPVVLVFGGSKGALSINRALYPLLPELLQKCQIVHISGSDNWEETQQMVRSLPSNQQKVRYHAFPYLHETMGAALAAADLVVCRAGASTLGELPFFNLPAILIPYPYAWRYQKTNADHLARNGGAIIIKDENMAKELKPAIMDLLENPQRLLEMEDAMKNLATPKAAEKIADIILESSTHSKQKGATQHD
ncbi:MAG: UDP-N-acetylglucosamine--N-acetylmuramyl-(pentapeptide) pyrophosphoryl-undecaprenol N-acetylglucosamine transferase [Anaerolinea thermophila]|uniref:UDP-N-acetylglucosamine--N-acetylmuramyl-(pentapeptide) pyrophosphoryl-undecaprenol N-acetylglucosamine transferase n=1 Tax=Anaerolinea thermophila TaxID=167964 RepID=A0A101FYM8_9CHLR|nr:MAG: UDP-N-acetylglucosamine--N-acetylmuramyl-(pentapeptide) pyrophosphoryl-undecaprenol N-acetylglucosamine transferase [Anaerolinea thermophila]